MPDRNEDMIECGQTTVKVSLMLFGIALGGSAGLLCLIFAFKMAAKALPGICI